MLSIPRYAEDEDLDSDDQRGLNDFAANTTLSLMDTDGKRRGWWLGWARCYGRGILASLRNCEESNPYPTFSGPWEAWARGYDEEVGIDI